MFGGIVGVGVWTDLKEWRERESGILALGAIGVGCAQGLEAHLPGLVPYLLQLLHDPQVSFHPNTTRADL